MHRLAALLLATTIAGRAQAETVNFGPDLASAGWKVVTFLGIPPAQFKVIEANAIEVRADAASGLLWKSMPSAHATKAQWSWRVDDGVGPTNLAQRGKDDRALAVYFVFGDKSDAGKGPMGLLSSSSTKALVYVFGGDSPLGSVLSSPHMGAHGKFIILRAGDEPRQQWLSEKVDLAHDFRRVFGGEAPELLAVAVSSDSDDTGGRNRAQLRAIWIDD